MGASTIAFPAISTGVYGYPRVEASQVAVRTLLDATTQVQRCLLVAYDAVTAALYRALLAAA